MAFIRKGYSEEVNEEYDRKCTKAIVENTKHLKLEIHYRNGKQYEDGLIDVKAYIMKDSIIKPICYFELEYHSGLSLPMRFQTIYFFAHKAYKYKDSIGLDKDGDKIPNVDIDGKELPTFYLKLFDDCKYIAITAFKDINLSNGYFSCECHNADVANGNSYYTNDTVENDFSNTVFVETKDYEKVIAYYLKYGTMPKHMDLNK